MNISIRHAYPEECTALYELKHVDMSWKDTDAPYFPYDYPSLEDFRENYFKRLCDNTILERQVIDVNGTIIGTICFYWKHEPSRWLEVGLAIFDKSCRGKVWVGKR